MLARPHGRSAPRRWSPAAAAATIGRVGASAIRQPAVAGSWYPGTPAALAAAVDGYLQAARPAAVADVTAIVAPHAGLMYSGPVAAYAYKVLAGRDLDLAVLVGPSHYVAFAGVSVHPRGAFETPLGPMPVEEEAAGSLMRASPVVHAYPPAHVREHSLEMQLPFLRRVLPEVRIVPLVMGDQTRDTILALAAALAEVLEGRRAVLIASTDLSHYFDADTAVRLDGRVSQLIEAFDADGLLAELERYPEEERGKYVACGGGPAVAVMRAAAALGARRARVLRYAHSGDVSGDHRAVVGYLAAAMGG